MNMKASSAKISLAILVSLLLAAGVQAQPKIAIIDLQKVFDNYYKTTQANTQLRESGDDMKKVHKGMLDDYQKTMEDYRKLMEGAKDPSLSTDERDKRSKSADSKLDEIRDLEKNIKQFVDQATERMAQQKKRMLDNILREIREVIDVKAKKAGYTLVLDTAALSISGAPIVLYHNGENDLTTETLTEMNAKAPPTLPKPDENKDTSPNSKDKPGDKKK